MKIQFKNNLFMLQWALLGLAHCRVCGAPNTGTLQGALCWRNYATSTVITSINSFRPVSLVFNYIFSVIGCFKNSISLISDSWYISGALSNSIYLLLSFYVSKLNEKEALSNF